MKNLTDFILESQVLNYNYGVTNSFKHWAVRNGLAGKKWYWDGAECVDGVTDETIIVDGKTLVANDKITWDEALEILKKWFEEHPQEKVTNEKQTWNDLEIDAIKKFFQNWSNKFIVEKNAKTGTLKVFYKDKPEEFFLLYRRKFTIRMDTGKPQLRLIKQHNEEDATLDDMFETLANYISKRYKIDKP